MDKLILFDVDGTLIDSGGAGSRAMDLTLEALTGIKGGFDRVNFAGKTDTMILREAFTQLGLDGASALVEDFVRLYPRYLVPEIPNSRSHVKPGVERLLETLSSRKGIHLGLLTGNLEQGARIKLDPFGLNHFFPFGAFGSDGEDRRELLPVAVRRFWEMAGRTVSYEDCVVVGDTPRDVDAAKPHGAACIATATGPYSEEALKVAGADLVVPDLSCFETIMEWIDLHVGSGD